MIFTKRQDRNFFIVRNEGRLFFTSQPSNGDTIELVLDGDIDQVCQLNAPNDWDVVSQTAKLDAFVDERRLTDGTQIDGKLIIETRHGDLTDTWLAFLNQSANKKEDCTISCERIPDYEETPEWTATHNQIFNASHLSADYSLTTGNWAINS